LPYSSSSGGGGGPRYNDRTCRAAATPGE